MPSGRPCPYRVFACAGGP
ncbi:hypothetical protein D4Q71_20975 [Rhodopseudomonas palustris]|nr:hypothetical protein D4Q71_20975 [Rhodopseudomonas palustris]